jgi:hypothetical protein
MPGKRDLGDWRKLKRHGGLCVERQTERDWSSSRSAPGAKPKLTAAQITELRRPVANTPDPKVHEIVRWRCVDLRAKLPGPSR